MYQLDEITSETPISFLTVGQLVSILKNGESKEVPLKKTVSEICGLRDACELTGYSKAAIYGKTSKNEIPHFKRDQKLLFRRSELVAWMTAKRIEMVEEKTRKLDKNLTKGRS